MVPFGLISAQDGSHGLWEASGMPPGPQNNPKKTKIRIFGFGGPGAPGALWGLWAPMWLWPILMQIGQQRGDSSEQQQTAGHR